MMKALVKKRWQTRGKDGESRKLKYSPIQDNPYDDLRGKIQDAVDSTEREENDVEGIWCDLWSGISYIINDNWCIQIQ